MYTIHFSNLITIYTYKLDFLIINSSFVIKFLFNIFLSKCISTAYEKVSNRAADDSCVRSAFPTPPNAVANLQVASAIATLPSSFRGRSRAFDNGATRRTPARWLILIYA